MTGKALVPVMERASGSWEARFLGRNERLDSEEELRRFSRSVADAGHYVWFPQSTEELSDFSASDKAFQSAVSDRLRSWVALGDERLERDRFIAYVAPGNDDEFYIDPILSSATRIVNGEGQLIELVPGLFMASCGYSNPTPWETAREENEEDLRGRFEAIVPSGFTSSLVLNFHVPPFKTNLDSCPELDDDFGMVMRSGAVVMKSAGSLATREFIESRQPIVSLHGHIHESKGRERLGRTICLNPGSTYGDGLLAGCLIDLRKEDGNWGVVNSLFTSG